MEQHSFKFDTGMELVVNEGEGFSCNYPDGSYREFDAEGNPYACPGELLDVVKEGDYIELDPTDDFFVVSKLDSGYHEEQKFEVGKANVWRVMRNDDGYIELITAKSVGQLKLYGLDGYKNAPYILAKISQACADCNPLTMMAWAFGSDMSTLFRLHIPDITNVERKYPYFDEIYKEDVEKVKEVGIQLESTNGVWLGSRYINIVSGDYYFGVHVLKPNGEVGYGYLNKSYIAGELMSHVDCYDVYACTAVVPFAKVIGGDGTEENPYKLGW